MAIIDKLKENALKQKRTVVLPEADDERTIKAASVLTENAFANVILLGNEEKIKGNLFDCGIKEPPKIINPQTDSRLDKLAKAYYEKRKAKGMTVEEATKTMKNPLFFGSMMVEAAMADCCVAGAVNTTSDVLRSALRTIGTKSGVKTVSSFMIMETALKEYGADGTLFFSDIAVVTSPSDEVLADIAIATADSWQLFMESEPKVALLSFATKGSAEDPSVDKVRSALNIVKTKRPDINIDGELQLDAAIVKSIGERKAPQSSVAGKANVLIFPDLNAANIGYKLTERFSQGATATGPILQGLNKPVNDLSRGATYTDIVNTALVSIFQAGKGNL